MKPRAQLIHVTICYFPKSYFPPSPSLSLSLFGAHMAATLLMRNYEFKLGWKLREHCWILNVCNVLLYIRCISVGNTV